MQRQVDTLQRDLEALPEQVAALSITVGRLETAVLGERGEDEGFSVIPRDTATEVRVSSASAGASNSNSFPEATLSWTTRETIAREIGAYIASALRGRFFGPSGRDKIPLRSRVWVVARTFDGESLNPPRAFRRWQLAELLTKRGDSLGHSVVVGFPSERECRVAVEAAGLRPVATFEE